MMEPPDTINPHTVKLEFDNDDFERFKTILDELTNHYGLSDPAAIIMTALQNELAGWKLNLQRYNAELRAKRKDKNDFSQGQ